MKKTTSFVERVTASENQLLTELPEKNKEFDIYKYAIEKFIRFIKALELDTKEKKERFVHDIISAVIESKSENNIVNLDRLSKKISNLKLDKDLKKSMDMILDNLKEDFIYAQQIADIIRANIQKEKATLAESVLAKKEQTSSTIAR